MNGDLLTPGTRVVWAPVQPGTIRRVVNDRGDGTYVVLLDNGDTLTCGGRNLVAIPPQTGPTYDDL